jgi:hypothetical protein
MYTHIVLKHFLLSGFEIILDRPISKSRPAFMSEEAPRREKVEGQHHFPRTYLT